MQLQACNEAFLWLLEDEENYLSFTSPENITQQDQSYQSSWLRGGDQRSTEQLEHEQTKQQGHNGLV